MNERKKLYEATFRLRTEESHLAVQVEMFGDHLAKREGYKSLQGLDAIHFYIVSKFGWLPSQVRSMSFDDLRFLLTEEMSGWTVPKELRGVFPSAEMP